MCTCVHLSVSVCTDTFIECVCPYMCRLEVDARLSSPVTSPSYSLSQALSETTSLASLGSQLALEGGVPHF